MHIVKAQLGLALQLQRVRAGRIGHFALFVHQGEHAVQIGEALLDFAVQGAQKVERNVQLDHEGIDHHQVAQRQPPIHHALGGAP
ncbi:hypothetical protein D3C71_2049430 [compost metagenome]